MKGSSEQVFLTIFVGSLTSSISLNIAENRLKVRGQSSLKRTCLRLSLNVNLKEVQKSAMVLSG